MKSTILFEIVFVILLAYSCKNDKKKSESSDIKQLKEYQSNNILFTRDTQLQLYSAYITIPEGWRRANDDTIIPAPDATSRYQFHNKNGKLIYLEYGLSTIGNPAEPNVIPSIFRRGYITNKTDTTDLIFTDDPRLSEIRKSGFYKVSTDSVSNFKATFFRPKILGQGYFVMYIDSIGQIAENIADLVIYGNSLDILEINEMEKVSRSIVIKDIR